MQQQASADNQSDILELERFLPYRLARAAELVSRDFSRIYKDRTGMTRPEWRALATLGQFGEVTATFIGQHSSMHKTKVSRAVAALERRGWLVRRADETDRRVEHLALSKNGWRIYRQLIVEAKKFETDLLQALGHAASDSLDHGLHQLEKRNRARDAASAPVDAKS
uniref:MarR family winged helix-turn-helix transcriptional regulator n=1 Tax=Pararhizobium sp. IMCC3301 TaxID=3067904 RepID=UPI002740BFCB|nr:MarR family transcriptional regulator [Pararhizobium sp. IMCC3301]